MVLKQKSIVERLTAEAVRLGVDELEIEYKDGYEEVVALVGSIGFSVARFRSSSREARSLCDELYGVVKKKRRVIIGDSQYDVRPESMKASARMPFVCSCDASNILRISR